MASLSSRGSSVSDSEGSEDDETAGPGEVKCEEETEAELNIAQFVKAELLYDCEDSDCGDEREEREDQDCDSAKSHIKTKHLADKVFKCDKCNKIFNKKTNLKTHLECVHTTYKPGQFVCSLCQKELKNQHSLKSHIREVHAEKVEDEIFRCEECLKIFKKKKDLRGHKYAAHKVDVRICEVCSGEYKNQTALKQHLRLVHGPTETVSCELCFKSFKNITRLKHHHLDVHKVDNTSCPDCGKTFKNRFLMKKHLRYLHRGPDGPRARAVKEDSGYSSGVVSSPVSRKNNSEEKIESRQAEVVEVVEVGETEESSEAGGVKREGGGEEGDWRFPDYSHSLYHSQDRLTNYGSFNTSGLSTYQTGSDTKARFDYSDQQGDGMDYRYSHHHHQHHYSSPMAYFNQAQTDSFGPGLTAYQVMDQLQLHSARTVTVMDQILQGRAMWGETMGAGGPGAQYVGRK